MDQSKKKKQKSIIHFFSPQSGSNSNIGGASETVIKNVEKRFVCQYCEVKVSHLGALKLHEHWCKDKPIVSNSSKVISKVCLIARFHY
jgi:hypothetical protein